MLGWLRERPAKARLIADGILEGMREIGVLFLAFAPLDAVLGGRPLIDSAGALLFFVGAGAILLGGALVFEWRRKDDG